MKICCAGALYAILFVVIPWPMMAAAGSPGASGDPGDPNGPGPLVTLEIVNDPPWDPPAEVHFSYDSPLTDIDDWQWYFGDGQAQFVPAPSHSYTSTGSFTVSLTVHSPSIGFLTIEQPGFVQVSANRFYDPFDDPVRSAEEWIDFEPDLLVDGGLELDIAPLPAVDGDRGGEENGRIICLPVGGDGGFVLSEPGGRFRFSVELFDDGLVADVRFSVLRLWAPSASALGSQQALAELRLRKNESFFEAQIVGSTAASPWLTLAGGVPQPSVEVKLDWFRKPASAEGVLEVRFSDTGAPLPGGEQVLRLDKLLYDDSEPGFARVELGVINITGHESGSEGKVRIESFGRWDSLF